MTHELGDDGSLSALHTSAPHLSAPHVKRKICLALAVSSVIPLLILAWAVYVHVLPLLDPARHAGDIVRIQALLVFTTLLIIAGAFIIWDLAIALSHGASMNAVAHQAEEIHQFARRLERAYADLEETNARLKDASVKDEVTGRSPIPQGGSVTV